MEMHIRGKSFLYHQVRNLAAALVDVGMGKLSIEKLQRMFEARRVFSSLKTAPACGLYLKEVYY